MQLANDKLNYLELRRTVLEDNDQSPAVSLFLGIIENALPSSMALQRISIIKTFIDSNIISLDLFKAHSDVEIDALAFDPCTFL